MHYVQLSMSPHTCIYCMSTHAWYSICILIWRITFLGRMMCLKWFMVLCEMRRFVLKIPWLLLRHEWSSLPTDLGERAHVTNAVCLTQTGAGVAVVSHLIPVSVSTSSSGVLTLGGGGYSNLFNPTNLVLVFCCIETNTFLHWSIREQSNIDGGKE